LIININIDPDRLAKNVSERFLASSSVLSVYWMAVSGDRESYAKRLRNSIRDYPIAVFIVRDISFSNPNAIAADVVNLITANRESSKEVFTGTSGQRHFGIVMLGRMPLSVAQSSSPVTLPDWFPIRPGETVDILVEDLTWVVDASLNCEEARVDDICVALYDLEGTLISRLTTAHQARHNAGNALMEQIKQTSDERYIDLLRQFAEAHDNVSVASAFRPSLRAAKSLISRIWGIVQKCNPDGLHKPSSALAAALDLERNVAPGWESIVSVLNRQSNVDVSPSQRFTRGMLMTVGASCQYITAAAHSDAYARYPVPLLISFSYDLRKSLREAEIIIGA
jgi:hypothetical protein